MSMANNNPTNLRYVSTITWDGQVDHDDRGFIIFATLQDGLNAAAKNLHAKQARHGLDCIEDIIGDPIYGWAPAADKNNVPQYVTNVCAWTHIRPEEFIDLSESITLQSVLGAIVREETGTIIDSAMLTVAANRALAAV